MKENGFINEFKKFIMRGNVMDMAVGVIVGGAFTAIVTSLNQDILTPILGIFGGTERQSDARTAHPFWKMRQSHVDDNGSDGGKYGVDGSCRYVPA